MRPRHLCLGCRVLACENAPEAHCFNEAEASLPRMRRRGALAIGVRRPSFNEAEASLPRMQKLARTRPGELRRFNEAEASLPRMQPRRTGVSADVRHASMRPRHLCLGCPRCARILRASDYASMRPRHLCLGCPDLREFAFGFCHRFNEAEASLPRMQAIGCESIAEVPELQ